MAFSRLRPRRSTGSSRTGGFGPYILRHQTRAGPGNVQVQFCRRSNQGHYPIQFFVQGEPINSGACSIRICTSLGLNREESSRCSCLGPTELGATCSRARSTAGASRCPLAWSACSSASSWACSWAASPATSAAWIDDIIQRIIDFLLAIPGLPLWMTLAAALPRDWPTLQAVFCHHHHPVDPGLDGPGARGARQAAAAARRGLHAGGPRRRRQRLAHHHPPPAARLHQPPDRVDHLSISRA